jgi:RHS repeat-associated protein
LPPNVKGSTNPLILTTNYGYDNADRMISNTLNASSGGNGNSYSFGYDLNGSLTTETNNVSGGEVTSYIFDVRNRLTQVQKNKGSTVLSTASFAYDGKNTRLSQTYGGKTTSYLQDATGLPVVLQETVNSQTSSFMYPLGSTSPLFQSDVNNAPLWYHADGLGSIRALTDGSGAIKNTNSYSAFGGNEGASGKATNNHLFAGEQLDPTGLYFNRARYYNPNMGRFTKRDTYFGNELSPQSQNRYTYAENNSVNFHDPSGFAIKIMDPIERQVLARACIYAMEKGLEPLCDIPSNSKMYEVENLITQDKAEMVLTDKEYNELLQNEFIKVGMGKRNPNWGSRRWVTLLKEEKNVIGGIADMLTLDDTPKLTDLITRALNPAIFCNEDIGFYSGVYEIEPSATASKGRFQLALYITLLTAMRFTKKNAGVLEGYDWIAGAGMSGFATSFTAILVRESYFVTAQFREPGLILFDKQPLGMNRPSPSPSPNPNSPTQPGCRIVGGRVVC